VRLLPGVVEADAEVAVVLEVARREAKVPGADAVAVPGLAGALSLVSLGSRSSRRSSAIAKKPNGRSLPRRPPSPVLALALTPGCSSVPVWARAMVPGSLLDRRFPWHFPSILSSSPLETHAHTPFFLSFYLHTDVLDQVSSRYLGLDPRLGASGVQTLCTLFTLHN